ncbi:alcohol oxidase [Wallemia mellicola]|nr:alcohol oxidase [Wallemia mellicola]
MTPSFEYVIVGGGTSGLVAANRLIQRGASVLVIEAGPDSDREDGVNISGMYGSMLNSHIDWKYDVGLKQPMPRGRTLGGSSAINFLLWNRPAEVEINAWNDLGVNGWDWDSLIEAMKEVETFNPPSEITNKLFGLDEPVDTSNYGHNGEIQLSYPRFATKMDEAWLETLRRLHIASNVNPADGNNVGANVSPITMNPSNFTRSYSASAFLKPVMDSSKLTIIDNATVSRVVTEKDSRGILNAVGVEYIRNGKKHSVAVLNKVVMAAGAISTPHILELSGIGDEEILKKYGIETILHQPNIGKNFQDHTYVASVFEVDSSVRNLDPVHFNPSIALEELAKYRSQSVSLLEQANVCVAYLTKDQLLDKEDQSELAELIKEVHLYEGEYKDQYLKQLEFLESDSVTQSEFINVGFFADVFNPPDVNKTYLTLLAANQHPFARGEVHIRSSNPLAHPRIQPNYLSHPIDVLFQKAASKYTRRIAWQQPLSAVVEREVIPGAHVQSEDDWEDLVKKRIFGEYHGIGTARIGKVDRGGVVDDKLRLHGANNIHIIDASVIPLHVSAHIQSLVYAIANKSLLYL